MTKINKNKIFNNDINVKNNNNIKKIQMQIITHR